MRGNGRIWKGDGMSLDDIGITLGLTSRDLGILCLGGDKASPGSGAVNQKSFRKPMDMAVLHELTDAQRRAGNWGWTNLQGNAGAALYQVLNAKGAGQKWLWNYPKGGWSTSPYRPLDFDGYDHNSDEPFRPYLDQQSYSVRNAARMGFSDFAEFQMHLHEWGGVNGDIRYMGIGVAFAPSASKTDWNAGDEWCLAVGYNLTAGWQDMEEGNTVLPSAYLALLGTGAWYAYPFIVRDTRDITPEPGTQRVVGMGRTDCIMLYSSPVGFEITGYDPLEDMSFSLYGTCRGDAAQGTYSGISLTLETSIGVQSEDISSVSISVYMDHCGTSPNRDDAVLLGEAALTAPAKGRTHASTVSYSGTIYPLQYDPKGEGTASVRAEVTVTAGGRTSSKRVTGQADII